jgi:hypothetical protein
MKIIKATVLAAISSLLCQCAFNSSSGAGGPPNMGGPTVEERNASIASEATGDFHYGRRYYVQKTRFWGYLRNPRQSADKAKLVIIREDRKLNPDRLPENGPDGQRYGFDQNYEYRMSGSYTGETSYDPNSNQILPEFVLRDYELISTHPGFLFHPYEKFEPRHVPTIPKL